MATAKEDTDRVCTACDTTKLIDEFPRNPGCKGGREPRCYDCRKAKRQRPGVTPKAPHKRGGRGKALALVTKPTAPAPPAFVEVEESFVIAAADDNRIALTAEELDSLTDWWRGRKKKAA